MGQVFYNQHINKVTPHLRRAQNADTYALKQPCLVLVTSDMHLESESEKRAKDVDFHTTKNIKLQPTLFRYF